MQLIQVFPQFGTVVRLTENVFVSTWPFLLFFFLVTMIFAMVFRVLGVDPYPSPDENDYEGMIIFFQFFMMSFRNSLGDLILPASVFWENDESTMGSVCFVIYWIIWFIQVNMMLVVLLNFLIAYISECFE